MSDCSLIMPRPVTIDDKVILKAAREMFLLHGFKAQSALIAKQAGVSEGTIFKRFKTKAQLFLTSMRDQEEEQKWIDDLSNAPGTNTVRENLIAAAMRIMEQMEVAIPRMLSLRASGVPMPSPASLNHRPPPLVQGEALGNYFMEEINLGRLTMAEPMIQAHMLIGAMIHYVMGAQMGTTPCHRMRYIETLVDLHLGLACTNKSESTGSLVKG